MPYIHGAYGEVGDSQVTEAKQGSVVCAYIGTAPVNLIRGYADRDLVNMPIKLTGMGDVQKMAGYSDDWASFTLCEAFAEHFDNTEGNIGPIYVVNVLNPTTHRNTEATTKELTIRNNRAEFASSDIILDTFAIADMAEGVDYTLSYSFSSGAVVVQFLMSPAQTAVTCTYNTVDVAAVGVDDIIGAKTDEGGCTGLYAMSMLYQYHNATLDILAAPGWSHIPAIYKAMVSTVQKLNGHWDGFVNADIPIEYQKTAEADVTDHAVTVTDANLLLDSVEVYNGDTKGTKTTDYTLSYVGNRLTVTLTSAGALYSATKLTIQYKAKVATRAAAIQWANDNGYTAENSKAYWPQIKDGSGRIFHLSTVGSATMLRVDLSHNGIPFESPSNKEIMATSQFFGESVQSRGFDQEDANTLNASGITTACFWCGRWVLWGPHTAAYSYEGGQNTDARAKFDVNLRMLMYITNKFQIDHGTQIDEPLTPTDKDTILNDEKQKLDNLCGIGALIGSPTVEFLESENPTSSMMDGEFVWDFSVTNTPPLKSATARVRYTDEGFSAFFESE